MIQQILKLLAIALLLTILAPPVSASPSDNINDNLAEQARLQNLINQAKSQENSLGNQISLYNNQIKLTQLQVNAKQNELNGKQSEVDQLTGNIGDLSSKIDTLQVKLTGLTKVAVTRFRVSEAVQNASPTGFSFVSGNVMGDYTNSTYLQYMQFKDQEVFLQLKITKDSLSNQRVDLQTRQASVAKLRDAIKSDRDALATDQALLINQKSSLAQLLKVTQNNEANYQSLLSQAKAQQQSLLAFANARVGSGGSILPHSDLSDDWGKYYNQRDSAWGNVYIGYSSYQIWQVGCLLTSLAMVFTHYGYTSYTPATIGADPSNFWSNTAALNLPGPVPPGHSMNHYNDPSTSFLKSQLQAGKTLIIGLSFNGGSIAKGYWPDHWVVARGLDSRGEFVINDPWYQSAINVSLDYSHPDIRYADWMVIEARVYQ